MRISVGFLMVFALIVALIGAGASYLREVATSGALVNAAARGTSRLAVPSPDQVASVINQPASQLSFFGWGNAVLAGVLGLVGLIVALAASSPEAWVITLSAIGYALVMSLLGYACQQWLPRPHAKRRARIAAHWSAEDEARAWKRAKGRGGAEPLVSGAPRAAAFIYSAGLICLGWQEVSAEYRAEALAAMLVSVGLFVASVVGTGIASARGRELRNALMQRWPTIPQDRGSEGKPTRRNRGLAP
jgi:hypothetical protein